MTQTHRKSGSSSEVESLRRQVSTLTRDVKRLNGRTAYLGTLIANYEEQLGIQLPTVDIAPTAPPLRCFLYQQEPVVVARDVCAHLVARLDHATLPTSLHKGVATALRRLGLNETEAIAISSDDLQRYLQLSGRTIARAFGVPAKAQTYTVVTAAGIARLAPHFPELPAWFAKARALLTNTGRSA